MPETTPELDMDILDYLDPIILDMPTAIFVESRAAQSAGAAIDLRVNYGDFLEYLKEMCPLVHAKYYWSLGLREDDIGANRFLRYLGHVGWDTWSSKANESRYAKDDEGQLYLASEASHIARYNPKVKMTVDAMVAASGIVSQVILFVRGSDYIPLIDALQAKGIRVICVGWTDRHMGADALIDLRRLAPGIGTYRKGDSSNE